MQFIDLSGVKPFSCLGKKRAKRSRHKGRYVQMRPLMYPPPHRRKNVWKSRKNNVKPLKIFPSAPREGYIGEGVCGCGSTRLKRLPYAAFFGYFPQRTQESDTYLCYNI